MRTLTGAEADVAWTLILGAALEARRASCLRSRCGALVVATFGGHEKPTNRFTSESVILGSGVNAPPDGCAPSTCAKDDLPQAFRSDRTCCVHAEQNAIIDALRRHPGQVSEAAMIFVRLNESGDPRPSGRPYCTICSKSTLAAGMSQFVLWHGPQPYEGLVAYDAVEYNRLSFAHAN